MALQDLALTKYICIVNVKKRNEKKYKDYLETALETGERKGHRALTLIIFWY